MKRIVMHEHAGAHVKKANHTITDQNVLRLEIAIVNAFRVEVSHSLNHLKHKVKVVQFTEFNTIVVMFSFE